MVDNFWSILCVQKASKNCCQTNQCTMGTIFSYFILISIFQLVHYEYNFLLFYNLFKTYSHVKGPPSQNLPFASYRVSHPTFPSNQPTSVQLSISLLLSRCPLASECVWAMSTCSLLSVLISDTDYVTTGSLTYLQSQLCPCIEGESLGIVPVL